MITRSGILDLFQPILARIDLGIIFADLEGRVLRCNDAARQILRLDAQEAPASLADLGGLDLLAPSERGGNTVETPSGAVCRNPTHFEEQITSPLEEPCYVQVRAGW